MALLNENEIDHSALLGEDTFDLFVVIEDSFGVDLDYINLLGKSVREIAQEIIAKSPYTQSEKCLSGATFYRLRRGMISLYGTSRKDVRPSTKLKQILPWTDRKVRWRSLQDQLNLTLPSLVFPNWLLFLSLAIAVPMGIWVEKTASRTDVAIGASFLALVCSIWLLAPLAREFPRGSETFGDLVTLTLARNYAVFAKEYGASSEDQLVALLIQLIAAETGRNVAEIQPRTLVPQGLNIY